MSKAQLIYSLVSWVPSRLGVRLRSILYQLVVAKLGKNVSIAQTATLIFPEFIEIGHQVRIGSNVIIDARSSCNILIGDQGILDESVHLKGCFGDGRICLKDQVRLNDGVYIRPEKDGDIEIGERTYLGPYTCLAGPGPVKIGSDCLISSHVNIYSNSHSFRDPTQKINEQELTYKGIVIEDDCWLGASVTVLDGVTIGKGSVIGANAVVTQDIPPYSVAVGVPAKVISHRISSQPK
jgi:acetyltransferase-like isoleucine patch superfamily enzyme